MSTSEDFGLGLGEAGQHHLQRVNDVLRRPGMYGRDEMAERLLLEAMAAVDGSLERWWAECDGLRDRDALTATGVMGAYSDILPADALRDATASMYAEIAHRLGWLELDRALSQVEFQLLSTDIDGWVTQDRTLPELIDTLAYTATDPDHDLICFHLGSALPHTAPEARHQGARPEAVVLAVRHRPGRFADAFSFTPEGLHRKPSRDQLSPVRSTVWIFHGERAQFASGVFDTLDAGLNWAAEHHVTGILAEYAIGGAYDVAVSEGRFRPSKTHHGTPEHVAGFGPGLRHIHLTDGRRD